MFEFVCGVILYLGVSFFFAGEFAQAASAKGYPQRKYYWISFLMGLPGWLLVIALPDRGADQLAVPDELPDL